MTDIKAIQTEYNGLKFRSRLEAKWAVFFDTAKIRYEYEPEGYETEDGERYLPDFYLPDFDLYVEVKRDTEAGRKEIIEKCKSFIQWGGKIKMILILSDIPGDTVDGGKWAFPVLCWEYDSVAFRYWTFWYVPNDARIYGCIATRLGSSIRYGREGEHFLYDSIKAVSSNKLDDEKHYRDKWKIIEYAVGFREIDEIMVNEKENIEEEKNVGKYFYSALAKARQARFEFGETPKKEE